MAEHTVRLRCTTAIEHDLGHKGWQWSAILSDDDADASFEEHGTGRCPYLEGRLYEVTVREVNDE